MINNNELRRFFCNVSVCAIIIEKLMAEMARNTGIFAEKNTPIKTENSSNHKNNFIRCRI